MMIKVQGKLPRKIVLACSGGVDSMAALDFLSRNHDVICQFVHHKTDTSEKAFDFLNEYYERTKAFSFFSTFIDDKKPKGVSKEEHWRNERYKIFHQWRRVNMPVVTCHHLDDCVEQWLFSSLHGNPGIIPYANGNVIRPFRLNRKEEFTYWCERHNVPWIEDESNVDTRFMRNYIRHEIMPHALHVNPGLHKVVKKKIINEIIS